ncbi:hypothetical protein [Lentilactobacillus farraginis]|uniref:Uncharacterized protein n=1 Tax=Lentilactobacillus farraginis DSM 18382 = JCM 14108 TaxID=1423743 RepID=X0PBG8_9LACO|nr:hypothetical protein [Lentilactobacillus farraginis]KRM10841.1 hypothetical protein FD41_GL002017 [Lentilactobacillus farraginis DSM 18382 = JCM 14108]GAF37198.1 hypothetical protein JCM14108_2216 [Lentilactobacillus farraginis DSM 18382 = JCM 14108]
MIITLVTAVVLTVVISLFGGLLGVLVDNHWHYRHLNFRNFYRYLLVSGLIGLIIFSVFLFEILTMLS